MLPDETNYDYIMKKLLMALSLICALTLVAHAEDPKDGKKKAAPTPEQKEARKALVAKYDANKDGKLDKEERAKITQEELDKAGFPKRGKKEEKK